jgi:acetyl esterase/lipase
MSDDELKKRLAGLVHRPLVLKVTGTERVRVLPDLVYGHTAEGQQLADVYLSETPEPCPIAIFIHGGLPPGVPGPKGWGFFDSWGRTIAASGLAGVVFNHRLGYPDTRIRQGAADLDAILRFVGEHASEWNADARRMALICFSAGGPLLSHPLRDHPANIRCLVSLYNILDISGSPAHAHAETAQTIHEFSPVRWVNVESPPIFVIQAGKDSPKLNETITAFVHRAIEVNAPLTLMIHPMGPHGFDNQTDDGRTREILETVIAFIQRHTESA